MNSAKRSDRWKNFKNIGLDENEILASFEKKTSMRVFSYNGENKL